MFTITGQVVGSNEKEIKNGQNKGNKFQEIQVMTGDQFKAIHTVTDFQKLPVKIGQLITLAVRVKAFNFRSGAVGLDLMTLRDQGDALKQLLLSEA